MLARERVCCLPFGAPVLRELSLQTFNLEVIQELCISEIEGMYAFAICNGDLSLKPPQSGKEKMEHAGKEVSGL